MSVKLAEPMLLLPLHQYGHIYIESGNSG